MSVDKGIKAGFGSALIILVLIAGLSYRSTRGLIETDNWVSHTHEVIDSLDDLLVEMLEAESAARGYVMAGDAVHLDPYYAAVKKIDQTLEQLDRLTEDNPRQQRLLERLRPPIADTLAFHARKIDVRKREGFNASVETFRSGTGSLLMDEFRGVVARMRAEENSLLASRTAAAQRDAEVSTVTLVLGSLLSIAILSAVYYHLVRQIARRKRSEQRLIHLNRLYSVLSQVNQATVRIRERDLLFREVCRVTVEYGSFKAAWVGVREAGTGRIEPVAQWGVEDGDPARLHIVAGDRAENRDVIGSVLWAGQEFVSNNISADPRTIAWRDAASRAGYRSAAVFPIRLEGRLAAVLALYASEPGFFDEETIALLHEIGSDLSFALESMEQESRRKRADEVLRRQAQILDQVHDSVITTDLEGRVTSWNKGAEALTGYGAEEALGRHISFVYAEEEEPFVEDRVIAPLKRNGNHETEVRMRRKSGEDCDIHLSLSLLHDERSAPVGMIGYSIDIGEAKRAQQALRDSEERFRSIFEQAAAGMATVSLTGNFLQANPAMCRFFGYGEAELLRLTVLDVTHPADMDAARRSFEEIRAGSRRLVDIERRYVRKDGRIVWGRVSGACLQDASGKPLYAVVLVQDITERKWAEDEARRLNEELERRIEERTTELAHVNQRLAETNEQLVEASRLKSEFLARMSHELRTPMNAIVGFSDLLAEASEGPLRETYKRYVDHIREGARHLLELINDVLDLSKIEAGRVELFSGDIHVAECLAEVLSVITPLAGIKKLRVEREVAAELRVYADRTRFKQILYNLLSNAVKFTPEGGRISIEAFRKGECVSIAIADTGVGIPAEEHVAIFDEFHQVGTTTKGLKEGTGLGLAITKGLVELHSGTIRVESEPGRGSRFTVTLPAGLGEYRAQGTAAAWGSDHAQDSRRR